MLEGSLSHRLSRENAEKITIDEVIKEGKVPNDAAESVRRRQEDAFKKFKAAWVKIKHFVEGELGLAENVPFVNEMSPVSMCLVNSEGSGRYLYTALKVF